MNEQEKISPISSGKHVIDKLLFKAMRFISDVKPHIMSSICGDPTHKIFVMRKIIFEFLKTKVGHMCTVQNDKMNSLSRHKHKKMPIFKHE